ncbi:MAG: Hsp70 family protein [Phycisphaerae bacterium]|nr:Hsp70 family protein [Phycisphaerae bacterium]
MEQEPIIGIDLGTTNSEVAILEGGRAHVILEDGQALLPSVVGLSDDGQLLVGEAARNQWLLAPQRTLRSVKRRMGEDVKLTMGDQEFSPQEASAMILRELKLRAQKHLGREVSKAVITVPAYFNDAQRQATREAGELAGLEVVRIINEPTAASLTYEANQSESQKILVYDLGGGTFDVSIVQIEKNVVEVLASHGDTHLGGDDFDKLLIDHVADGFKNEHGVDLREDLRANACLWRAVERAKIRLSAEPYARIEEEFIIQKKGKPLHLSIEVSRDEYEGMIRPLIERTMKAVQTSLENAGLQAEQIDRIVLAGGATRTPLVGSELQERTGREPHLEVDPDLCVAMGAAIQAGVIAGADVGAVLVDITPYTFGVSCLGMQNGMPYPHCFSPIIHKNTPLPASRTQAYYTTYDNQERVDIHIYQGDDPDALKNTLIGRFTIEGLSDAPENNPITCGIDLDLDGILKVTAREKVSGLEKHIVIDNAISRFEEEGMSVAAERLKHLFGDTEEKGETTSQDEAVSEEENETTQIRTLLERVRGQLPGFAQENQDDVIALIEDIDDALHKGDLGQAQTKAQELEDILFYLDEA